MTIKLTRYHIEPIIVDYGGVVDVEEQEDDINGEYCRVQDVEKLEDVVTAAEAIFSIDRYGGFRELKETLAKLKEGME